ncbi:Gfo/Idh/MocA family oxidoreductase [Streptomyces sp. ISL-1]|uniref:Gfo/Idh/MocA family protein n=1 Tax=Streptomyces sp. ISL-1 TaxID=2817657 RepID=UPI001BEA6AF2|nr:Gfo/Idh/MocA family oxidoreductase [Streptomyces sp. ISL-1]MBT2393945.1 Gfo/Idh/MocA family oxidoreductase [Streptomyces sp. ISL-1]
MKVALLSFAHVHATTYIQLLSDRNDIELIVTDPDAEPGDPTRGKALADELRVTYRASYEEVLAERPRAVIITSENARHRKLVEQAASAGAHILCEKPLATTEDDARAMIDTCEQAGVSLMTAYPVRFHPAFAALRHTLTDGTLGPLLSVHGVNNSRPPALERPWFADPALAGGGAIIDHTLHVADLLDVLLDGEQPTHVHAVANTLLTPDGADRPEVESAGLLTLTYANGLVATIDCSWSHPATHPTWGGLTLTCVGRRALVEFDAFPPLLTGYDTAQATTRWEPAATDLDAAMLDRFLTAARTGQRAHPDGETGLRTLKTVLAAYTSLRTGQPATTTAA